MIRRFRRSLTYANVMATAAVFIALGGVGYATIALPPHSVGTRQLKDNAVTGSKVKNHSLAGADIDLSKLGQVPSAGHAATADSATLSSHATTAGNATTADAATHATTADNATHATTADNATHATTADNATHATTADNATHATSADSAAAANTLAAPEPFREVNTAGEPAFDPGCTNLGAPWETVAFFKDQAGIVHLRGEINGCATNYVFALPAGYRPATGTIEEFGGGVAIDGPGISGVPGGQVICTVGLCDLNGITFRAAS
jgi:hypothetical protein